MLPKLLRFRLLLVVVNAICWTGGLLAAELADPKKVTPLSAEERAKAIERATEPGFTQPDRVAAIKQLANDEYSPEVLATLIRCATNPVSDDLLRGNAELGVTNFLHRRMLKADAVEAARVKLREAFRREPRQFSDGMVRILIGLGDADLIFGILEEDLHNKSYEIDVLQALTEREPAKRRLDELYKKSENENPTIARWAKRQAIGKAFIVQLDKRGFDILIECLLADEAPLIKDATQQAEDRNREALHQSQHSLLLYLINLSDETFDYPNTSKPDPSLPKVAAKFGLWWDEHRRHYDLPGAFSNDLPVLEAGKELTKRQARLLAAKLANLAYVDKKFVIAGGKPAPAFEFKPDSFYELTKAAGRWTLNMKARAGPSASVSFDLDGSNEKVEVNFATR